MNEHANTPPIPHGPVAGGAADYDSVLTSPEMAALNARLAALTSGRVAVGPDPVTRRQARALWHAAQTFTAAPANRPVHGLPPGRSAKVGLPDTRLSSSGRGLAALMLSAATISGCTTFGGNVKGGFACRAPDGICAPTSKIDDQALAMISGGDDDRVPTGMAGPGTHDDPRFTPTSSRLTRTSEKVLRIVFPAHVDRQGRFREASAIHAVVERSAWAGPRYEAAYSTAGQASGNSYGAGTRFATAGEEPSLAEMAAASPEVAFPAGAPEPAPESLAETTVGPAAAVADPGAPSAAAVMAARHKGHAAKVGTLRVPPSLFAHQHKHGAPGSPTSTALAGPAPKAALAHPASETSPPSAALPSSAPAAHGKAAPSASPLQSIRDQVGTIFAGHALAKPAGNAATATGPSAAEHPANGPAVLPVSEASQ